MIEETECIIYLEEKNVLQIIIQMEEFIVMAYEKMVKVVGILSVEKREYFLVFPVTSRHQFRAWVQLFITKPVLYIFMFNYVIFIH